MLASIARGAGAVAVGTAAGQGIVLVATPWLARQHSPAEFGALALLMTVSNVATAVACARYDLALPGASDAEAPALLRVACAAAAVSAGLAFLIIAAGHEPSWTSPFDAAWLVGLCVVLVGLQQAAIGASTRERRYAHVGALRFGQGATFAALAALPGVGLVLAHAMSFVLAVPVALKRLAGTRVPLRDVAGAARERRDFPLLSLPGAALDVLGYSACIWIVVHFFGTHDAGQYSQIQRVVGAPLMLVGMSAGQVLLRAGVDALGDRMQMEKLLRRLCLLVGTVGLVLISAVAIFGDYALHWLLGAQWRVDAAFVVPITVAVTVRACVSPLSTLLITLRRFDLALRWQVAYFLSSILVLGTAAAHLDIGNFVLVYAAHELLLYGLYLLLIAKAIRTLPCAASSA